MLTCIRESGSTPHLAIMGENRIGMYVPMSRIRENCESLGAVTPRGRTLLACSQGTLEVLPSWETWGGTATEYACLVKHENGHVNGWPSDHPK
jgi:hypothetical protein